MLPTYSPQMKLYNKALLALLVFIFVLIKNTCIGQTDITFDSLVRYSLSFPNKKVQIKNLLSQANKYLYTDAALSLKIAQKGISKISKEKQTDTYIEFVHCIALAQSNLGLVEMGLYTLREAEDISLRQKRYYALGKTHSCRSKLILDNLQSARVSLKDMPQKWKNELNKNLETLGWLVNTKKIQGLEYEYITLKYFKEIQIGNYAKAQKILLHFYENGSLTKDMEISILNNLAALCLYQQNYENAILYFEKTYALLKPEPFSMRQFMVNVNIAEFYRSTKQYDQALFYAKESLDMLKKLNIKNSTTAFGPMTLAKIYEDMNNHGLALTVLKESTNKIVEVNESINKSALMLSEEQIRIEGSKQKALAIKRDKIQTLITKINQKEYLLMSIFVLAVLGIISLLFYFTYRVKLFRLQKEENFYSARMELDRKTIHDAHRQMSETTQHLNEINDIVSSFQKENPSANFTKKLSIQLREIEDKINLEKSWSTFQEEFRSRFPEFEKRLYDLNKNLSLNDLKISFLLKYGYGNAEIAQMKGIGLEGVKTAIKRLKKKLNLEEDANISDFLYKL